MTPRIPRSPKTCSLTFDRVGSRIEGRGAPVVLLHSSMSSKGQWRELIQRMRDCYRLIAIDLHGYGDTSLPQSADCFALDDEVRLVESVLTSALQTGQRFHLVGHSYGGVVALQLAQRQPQRVRSLSLFEPIPFHLLTDRDPGVAELHTVRRQIEASLKSDDALRRRRLLHRLLERSWRVLANARGSTSCDVPAAAKDGSRISCRSPRDDARRCLPSHRCTDLPDCRPREPAACPQCNRGPCRFAAARATTSGRRRTHGAGDPSRAGQSDH